MLRLIIRLLVVTVVGAPGLAQTNAYAGARDDGIPPPLSEADLPPPLGGDAIPAARAPHVVPLPNEVRSPVPIPAPHEVTPPVPMPAPHEVQSPVPLPRPEDVLPPVPPPSAEEMRPPVPIPSPWELLDLETRKRAEWEPVRCYAKQRGAYREIRCQIGASDDDPGKRAAPASPVNDGIDSSAASQSGPAGPATCGTAEESQVLALLNETRRQHGLGPLACSARAVLVARGHSQDMCSRRFFGHFSPEGDTPGHRLARAGISHRTAGENVARGYSTAGAAHAGWMGSVAHRRNMLRSEYTHVGVGLVECDGTGPYWTQVFYRDQ